ncbi:MAG TPA: hypothetical protein VGH15_08415 [Caulobacteraceae bacterium]
MAAIHWANPISGDFALGLNWVGGKVPGPSDTAVLGNLGSPYVVLAASGILGLLTIPNQRVTGIQVASGNELDVWGGVDALDLLDADTKFTATQGTNGGVNAGKIDIRNNTFEGPLGHLLGTTATLEIGGTFTNTGLIAVDAQPKVLGILDDDQTATLEISRHVLLNGGGEVTLSHQRNDYISGVSGVTALLDNVDNTISGAGAINRLTLINEKAGIVDATGPSFLSINSHDPLQNAGLLEASSHGTLLISRTIIDNTGAIAAQNTGKVVIQSVDVRGGLVETFGSGVIVTNNRSDELDGSASPVTVIGNLRVRNNTALTLNGAIDNEGRIVMACALTEPAVTDLIIGADGARLTGGGQIRSTSEVDNHVIGLTGAATLDNVDNSLILAGSLGSGRMTLVNERAGRILATSPTRLTINTGANAITNAGLIESTGSGGMTIDSAVVNTGWIVAVGGNLAVLGAVTGAGRAFLRGATLEFNGAFSEDVVFLKIPNGNATSGTLRLGDSAAYTGTISNFSKSGSTALDLTDIAFNSKTTASYSGTGAGGVLTVTNGAQTATIHFAGDYLGSTFTVSADGHGGTTVTDPTKKTATHLVSAMAQMATRSAGSGGSLPHEPVTSLVLAAPASHA